MDQAPKLKGKLKTPETLVHNDAFEFWFWLDSRSFRKVSEQFRVTETAVRQWHAKFQWARRAEEREAKIKRAIADKNDAKALQTRGVILKTAEDVLARFGERLLRTGRVDGATLYEPTAADAARWASIAMVLNGEATGRTDHTVSSGFVDAFFGLVGAVLRRELPRSCPNCKCELKAAEAVEKSLVEASARLLADAKATPAAGIEPVDAEVVEDDEAAAAPSDPLPSSHTTEPPGPDAPSAPEDRAEEPEA